MQANWSLIINVLLLIVIIITISRMMKTRKEKLRVATYRPSIGQNEAITASQDDIIAVRKVAHDTLEDAPLIVSPKANHTREAARQPAISRAEAVECSEKSSSNRPAHQPVSIMMLLLAKDNRKLAGYDLLQSLLAAGLRFGEGQLFHRHQSENGQGPVLFSLAAATPEGTFDLQNIGAFSVRGLCLFMEASGNSTIDMDRLNIMLDTAKQLSDGLDTYLLDEQRQPLTEASVQRYYHQLKL